jgi:hypothetical protein
MQVSTVGLRQRHKRLVCVSMSEVSRDTVAAGEEQLASCAAEQSKYCSICTVALGPCCDLPFKNWGRWQGLRGDADVGFNSCYAVCGCGTSYMCGVLPGGGERGRVVKCLRRWRALPLAEMIPFHSTKAAGSKFPSKVLWTRFGIVLEGPNRFQKWIGLACSRKGAARHHYQSATHHRTPQLHVQRNSNFCRIPLYCSDFYSKLRAPHRGTSLGPLVCGANNILRCPHNFIFLVIHHLRQISAWLPFILFQSLTLLKNNTSQLSVETTLQYESLTSLFLVPT